MGRIEIVGLVGAGKTSLQKWIESFNLQNIAFAYEEIESIESVWRGVLKSKKFFFLQSAYYAEAYKILNKTNFNKIIISDFSLYVHHWVYSKTMRQDSLLTAEELEFLQTQLTVYNKLLPPQKGVIYLSTSAEQCFINVQNRNRLIDRDMKLMSIQKLEACIEIALSDIIGKVNYIEVTYDDMSKKSQKTQDELIKFLNQIAYGE